MTYVAERTHIVGVNGSPASPSRTRVVVEMMTDGIAKRSGLAPRLIDMSDAAPLTGRALRRQDLDSSGEAVIRLVETARALVVGTPVYRGSYTGILKHLFDLVDHRALRGTPVVLVATGGSDRHALALEHQLRPLFGFFAAVTAPSTVYATEADFLNYGIINQEVIDRIEIVATQAAALIGIERLAA